MKYTAPIFDKNNKIKEQISIFCMVIVSIFLAFVIKDVGRYGVFMHSIYATILIAMVIIVFNTMKFSIDKFSIFLGIIFAVTGILEIIYVFVGLNLNNALDLYGNFSIIISTITDVLPIIGIYLSFNYIKENNNIIQDVIITTIIIILSVASIVILINFLYNIEGLNLIKGIKIYTFDIIATIFIIFMVININKKIKCNSDQSNNEKKYFFRKIVLIILLSRIPTLLYPLIKDVYIQDILSQIIVNIAMYYLYKYIVNINVKNPYIKLNEINESLIQKTDSLKENNKKLIQETEKIQDLKDILSSKEAKLQSTLDVSVNSIIVFDKNKEITYANKTFVSLFKSDGDKKECIIEKDLKPKLKNYEDLIKNIDHILDTETSIQDFIYTIDNKVYQAIFAPLIIKSKLEGVLCILIDKTKKKEFEEKIIEANERYENFLESIGDGIVVLQGKERIYVNKACKDIFKSSIDEINFCIYDKKDNREERYIVEGKEIYVEMSFSEYFKNEENKTIIVIRDITSRKIAQMKLKESQKSYARFIDILPDGICLLNEKLDIFYANKSLMNMLEMDSIDKVKNTKVKNIITLNFDEENKFDNNMRKVLNENKYMLLLEHELIAKSKRKIQVEVNALPFAMDENKYIMLIIKDLTNKKTSEMAEKELLERLKTDKIKTEFFANMSHELKTPLNVISSSNQLIDSFYRVGKIDDYNDNVKSHIELVRQSTYRLQRLINNIIDLTKMESGFYKIKLAKHNIVEVIEDLFMKVEEYSSKKDISLIFDTELEEINIYMDKSQIERIILNILSNCIKFTPNGGEIFINIYYKVDRVLISVKDTGVGIPKNKLDLIFEEFIQVDKTLSRNTEGSGIGLAIVKNLVNLHGGDIEVKSEENRGTEFLIRLPVVDLSYQEEEVDRRIDNIDEKIKIEFSDIYY